MGDKLLNILKLCLIILAVFLQSCSFTLPTGPDFPEDIERQSRVIVETLLEKELDTIEPLLLPAFKEIEGYKDLFNQIFGFLPDDEAVEIHKYFTEERVGNLGQKDQYPLYLTAYELEKENDWVLTRIYVRKLEEKVLLQHIQVDTFDHRPSTLHDFKLGQKSFKHHAFFVAMISVFSFILFSLYKLVRDKNIPKRRKWLWFIFIMCGYWGAKMNWTTGDISNNFFQITRGEGMVMNFKFFKANLFGAGFTRMGHLQPWIMDMGLPLGALTYWFARRRREKTGAQEKL